MKRAPCTSHQGVQLPPCAPRFEDYEERQFARERMSAERMARAAAWEWEKQEAKANKVRVWRRVWGARAASVG